MTFRYALCFALLCPLAVAAPCATGQPQDGSALIQIEKTWARSLEQRDVATLGCILADEFEDAGPDGMLTNRTTTLAKAVAPRSAHHELSELTTHVYGDAGYIRGLATAADPQGKVLARVRFTDLYVYRDGRWQCVAGQESLLSDRK